MGYVDCARVFPSIGLCCTSLPDGAVIIIIIIPSFSTIEAIPTPAVG